MVDTDDTAVVGALDTDDTLYTDDTDEIDDTLDIDDTDEIDDTLDTLVNDNDNATERDTQGRCWVAMAGIDGSTEHFGCR